VKLSPTMAIEGAKNCVGFAGEGADGGIGGGPAKAAEAMTHSANAARKFFIA